MLRGFIVYVVFCLLAIDSAIQAQDHNRAILQRKLTAEIEKVANAHDGVMGVAIKDLTTGEEILINDQLVFPTGSSIKIPVLIELHKQASASKYKLTDQRWIERADKVGGSGVIVKFGDHASQLSLNDLAVLMIVLSDNTGSAESMAMSSFRNGSSSVPGSSLAAARTCRCIARPCSASGT